MEGYILNSNRLKGVEIVIVSTVPFFLVNQLASHIYNLKEKGMKITLVTSAGEELQQFYGDKLINVKVVEIPRKIQPIADISALFILVRLFYSKKFTIMHSTTPKAGLLCAIAAKLTAIPVRLHTFTGQVWVTKSGVMKWMLQSMDKIIISLNTHCYVDSPSQYQFLIDSEIAKKEQISSYSKGSLAGVDLERFSSQRFNVDFKIKTRSSLNVSEGTCVLTFIGRLTRDKGIYELLASFESLQKKNLNIKLILLGPMEDRDSYFLADRIENLENVIWMGNVCAPEKYLSITDILCLPSYREGFGTVVIEASAMGVPTVGSNIPGLIDAIDNGVTGILVTKKNEKEFSQALEALILDQELLTEMKIAAQEFCALYFDSKKVNASVEREYIKWLNLAK